MRTEKEIIKKKMALEKRQVEISNQKDGYRPNLFRCKGGIKFLSECLNFPPSEKELDEKLGQEQAKAKLMEEKSEKENYKNQDSEDRWDEQIGRLHAIEWVLEKKDRIL